jgi:CubicO group peptidase (beta-lactamase class C family)
MFGFYTQIGYNNIFISKPRTMARFGLLLQNQGIWNGTPVLNDPDYFQEMTHSSQSINPSYGYLTWLNGQSSYMVPGLQLSFPGSPLPNAPADLYSALGKNGQIINVSPSTGLVVVRMGDMTDNNLIPVILNDSIWYRINHLACGLSLEENTLESITLSPNPALSGTIIVNGWQPSDLVRLMNTYGQAIDVQIIEGKLNTRPLPAGTYLITINRSELQKTFRFVVN